MVGAFSYDGKRVQNGSNKGYCASIQYNLNRTRGEQETYQHNNLWDSLIPRLHVYFRCLTLETASSRDEVSLYT